MKKLVLITAAILTSLTLAYAQGGMGYNHGGQHHGGHHTSGTVGYNAAAGQGQLAMHPEDFRMALDRIRMQSFDEGRLSVARQVARTNQLRSRQVMRIMRQFSFESTRLKFAKFAYRTRSVVDPQNYFQVNEAFSFNSSVRKLDMFIASLDGAPAGGGSCSSGVTTYSTGTMTATGGVRPSVIHHGGGGNVGINHGAPTHGGGYYGGSHGGMNPGVGHNMAAGFNQSEFQCMIRDLRNICFDSERLATAKRRVCTKPLTSRQVLRIAQLFSFESNRLDFAKHAYLQTCDKQNYFMVNDAFSFNSSVRNLECYINSL